MKFSVIIPAHNERGCIAGTLEAVVERLEAENFDYEILVIADHCQDDTEAVVNEVASRNPRIGYLPNPNARGFGMAVRCGLDHYTGDAVAVYMADASDSPEDLGAYFHRIDEGAECVFGSRFIRGSAVRGYPLHKLILNRLANLVIRILFWHGYNDTTNAFKCYRREVIDACRPLLAVHFNLTVELPLKAIIRGYKYEIIPISWENRKTGISKLRIREMGSRYLFIIFYCFLERLFASKDYRRVPPSP